MFTDIYRREVGRCTATLVRVLGDIDAAEEAVADAFAVAAERWNANGIPQNPGGWITTTARNKAIDRYRRDSNRHQQQRNASYLEKGEPTMAPELGNLDVVEDDQLRLMFLCCHPALSPDAQVALTLRLLGGLQTTEIARAFLLPESTLAQRLVRAKRKIRDTHMSHRLPTPHDLPARLPSVLGAIYLIFNEGYTASEGEDLARPALAQEAIRLGRLLARFLPNVPETSGLLALMLLTEARRLARTDRDGQLVRLADQDRSSWDQALIAEGHGIVRRCLQLREPGVYQIQAAIAAVHTDALVAADTDWPQILALYNQLLIFRPHDIVKLNRAIVVAEIEGPKAGLEAIDSLQLDRYYLFHATRAEFLVALGDQNAALTSMRRAIELTKNQSERLHLQRRHAAVSKQLSQ